jgi:uncharacterized damage-inducible protein DinB
MSLALNFRMMAIYNQRMNQQLIGVCEQLSPEQLNQETHSFFSTVMCHWNHILFGDLIMLRRLTDNGVVEVDTLILQKLPIAKSVTDQFVNNLENLKSLRAVLDEVYVNITQAFTADCCTHIVKYTTTEGGVIERTVGEFFQHLFNHQTHHRGQLTCVLSQFGLDFGCTDLPILVPEGTKIGES